MRVIEPHRFYVIDLSGHVIDLYEPECSSDEEATSLVGNASVDIWQGDRWIGWVDGKDPRRIDLMHHVAPQ